MITKFLFRFSFFLFGSTWWIWKFLGQGSNPSHIYDLHHVCVIARCLTRWAGPGILIYCTIREMPPGSFLFASSCINMSHQIMTQDFICNSVQSPCRHSSHEMQEWERRACILTEITSWSQQTLNGLVSPYVSWPPELQAEWVTLLLMLHYLTEKNKPDSTLDFFLSFFGLYPLHMEVSRLGAIDASYSMA